VSVHLSTAILAVMVVGVLSAASADVKTRRIPNLLTGTLAAIALAANVPNGLTSVAVAALVMLVAFIAGTFAFSLGWFGGGDVKLLAACCGFAGFPGSIELLMYTLMAGGVVSLVALIRQRRLKAIISDTYQMTLGLAPASQTTVPYGVAIAAGTCTYALSTIPIFHFLRLSL
jgi:prepilin peptidase CpaA